MNTDTGFFKNHADTLAIIGVNLAIGAILISMWISHASRIDSINSRMDCSVSAANARMDTIHIMIYDILREGKK